MVVTSISPAHRPLSSPELIVLDLDSAVVERERANIDLLIILRDLNLIITPHRMQDPEYTRVFLNDTSDTLCYVATRAE